jgi:hypothetical protein
VSEDARRSVVGVFPASAHAGCRRLLTALEEAFPVRFEGRGEGQWGDLDALLQLGAGDQAEAAAALGVPALHLLAPEPSQPGELSVQDLTSDVKLDRALRGTELPDDRLGAALTAAGDAVIAGGVLASCRGVPTWTSRGRLQRALLVPCELGHEEALRERLRDGRSAALLPLAHFLRELTAAEAWQLPAPRAAFLFDDPNLHWPSYGFVKLPALAEHARDHGYHAALATVPLDGWFTHPAARRALRGSDGAVSLLVHGNDHYGGELGRPRTSSEALAMAAQAQRRVGSFEARTGVAIDRVMVPPHEQCSQATVAGLRRCGFEALTVTQPFPWLGDGRRGWLAGPEGTGPLVGWRPADLADGLPVLLRHPLAGRSSPELRLRAFLGQPLVLYGHQADLLEGLDVLTSAVADIERAGPTRWCSLGEIAAASFETRRRGEDLEVRLLSRSARVEIPLETSRLRVEPFPGTTGEYEALLVNGATQRFSEPIDVDPGTKVEVALRASDAVDVNSVPAPRLRPLAVPRRILSEGRDRLQPLVSRAR